MKHNPFTPPQSDISADVATAEPASRFPVFLVAALSAIQILFFLYICPVMFGLVETGSIQPLGPMFLAIAEVLLLSAVGMLLFRNRGSATFLASCIGFALSVIFMWNLPLFLSFKLPVCVLGVAASLPGWRVARQRNK